MTSESILKAILAELKQLNATVAKIEENQNQSDLGFLISPNSPLLETMNDLANALNKR